MTATQSHASSAGAINLPAGAISMRSHILWMAMKVTQSHASSAGAINHLLMLSHMRSHIVWMTMKVTQSNASSAGASDQSSTGAISITYGSDVQISLC